MVQMIVRPPSARDLSSDTHWKHDALSRPLSTGKQQHLHSALQTDPDYCRAIFSVLMELQIKCIFTAMYTLIWVASMLVNMSSVIVGSKYRIHYQRH